MLHSCLQKYKRYRTLRLIIQSLILCLCMSFGTYVLGKYAKSQFNHYEKHKTYVFATVQTANEVNNVIFVNLLLSSDIANKQINISIKCPNEYHVNVIHCKQDYQKLLVSDATFHAVYLNFPDSSEIYLWNYVNPYKSTITKMDYYCSMSISLLFMSMLALVIYILWEVSPTQCYRVSVSMFGVSVVIFIVLTMLITDFEYNEHNNKYYKTKFVISNIVPKTITKEVIGNPRDRNVNEEIYFEYTLYFKPHKEHRQLYGSNPQPIKSECKNTNNKCISLSELYYQPGNILPVHISKYDMHDIHISEPPRHYKNIIQSLTLCLTMAIGFMLSTLFLVSFQVIHIKIE
jgi:hypothetical protein